MAGLSARPIGVAAAAARRAVGHTNSKSNGSTSKASHRQETSKKPARNGCAADKAPSRSGPRDGLQGRRGGFYERSGGTVRQPDVTAQKPNTTARTAARPNQVSAYCRWLSGKATTSFPGWGRPPGGGGASCST